MGRCLEGEPENAQHSIRLEGLDEVHLCAHASQHVMGVSEPRHCWVSGLIRFLDIGQNAIAWPQMLDKGLVALTYRHKDLVAHCTEDGFYGQAFADMRERVISRDDEILHESFFCLFDNFVS